MILDRPLTEQELIKLLWTASHPIVKIDQYDEVGYDLCARGYLSAYDAGYVDWFGFWAKISPKGRRALEA